MDTFIKTSFVYFDVESNYTKYSVQIAVNLISESLNDIYKVIALNK